MATYTYKEIKDIMKGTPKEWAGKEPKEVSATGWALLQGYFKKSTANWSYLVSTLQDKNGDLVNIVTVFGHIVTD